MFGEIVLAVWSCAGLVWWFISLRLVKADQAQKNESKPERGPRKSLSVFKPLPPLGAQGLRCVAPGLESFIAQLDVETELLLGVHEADRDFTGPFLKRLRTDYPHARLKVIFRTEPDEVANPKIAWQMVLAPHAEGELWLWSDADIIAPPGFLQSASNEFALSGAKMMTFPYVVRQVSALPSLFEALFVNAEFYPGVLLLRDRGAVDFGLGAAMLFRRADFEKEIEWHKIGAWLADDFYLGQKLAPVSIGSTTLATVPGSPTWGEALLHDFRWAKTIYWNRPLGSFSRIMILPVLGWMVAVVTHPTHYFGWVGLTGMIQADVLAAALISRKVGCKLCFSRIMVMQVWSVWRVMLWLLALIPWPVTWNRQCWWQAQRKIVKSN